MKMIFSTLSEKKKIIADFTDWLWPRLLEVRPPDRHDGSHGFDDPLCGGGEAGAGTVEPAPDCDLDRHPRFGWGWGGI